MSNESRTFMALVQDRQNKRILRLLFPHDDGPKTLLMANRLEAKEGLSRDFEYTVEVLAEDATIPLKDVQGKLVSIELVRGDGSLRYFSGYVFEFRLVRTDGSTAFYSMVLKPWLAYLHLRKDNYLFHGKNLREQTASIFSDYSAHPEWDFQVQGEDPAMTDACQYDESDHNYLNRRWAAAGWYYWYEHTDKGHKLVLADDSTAAKPIDGEPTIRFQRHAGAREEDALGEWTPVRRIGAGSVALAGYNFKSPVPANVDVPAVVKQGDVLNIESYEYAGALGFKNNKDGNRLAQLRMEEIEAAGKHFEGAGNNRYALPGRWFRLTDHFKDNPYGQNDEAGKNEFLILEVHHSATNNYLQQADAPPDYSNRVTCIRKIIPWRPGRNFSSVDTKILAPQTATVVGPSGPDSIHTDEYGRIRVQFHWDRIGNNDEKSSAWVRVASSWAGSELGAAAIPRVGSEVIVQWLGGVPDRPIVTGAVFNERNMPPWKLSTQQALMGVRSRELVPEGGNAAGGRSNHLILDDTNAKIQAQLKSDHLHSQLSLGHITRIESNMGRKDARGEGFGLETGGAGALRATKGLLLSTDGRANAVGGVLSRDELINCLEKALDLAKGLGQAASDHQGAPRNAKPQQALTEAVDALGHGVGNETEASGPAPGGIPVIAIISPAGIATATPRDQTHYAGENIDTVAQHNQQHYAGQSILQTAGKDIEQFTVDGDIRLIANKGNIIQQAQHNAFEITADKSVTVLSTKAHILMAAEKHLTMTSGGAYIKIADGNIEIVCPGNLIFKSASRSFTGPGSMKADMPKFDTGPTGRQFLLHREGDKSNKVVDHNYKITLDDGQVVEGKTGADGLTKLAENDAMRIANIKVWKEPV